MKHPEIPKGIYCYDERGVCPHLKSSSKDQFVAYCDLLDLYSEQYDSTNLLWDQCKECEINMEYRDEELERIITHLDTLYEMGEDCTHPDTGLLVTDGEYDQLRRELFDIHPTSELFAAPSASEVVAVKKIKHDPPLTSISKASHEDRTTQQAQLDKWKSDTNSNDFCMGYKLDGIALGLYYKDGKLISAGLRPRDGINGEDITTQVKYVADIPQELPIPITCSIRGELICKKSDFVKVQDWLVENGEKLRANPRNHTAGGIRQFKEPAKVANMRLSFIAYSIVNFDTPVATEIERADWVRKTLNIPFIDLVPLGNLDEMEQKANDLDFEVDGVVISVNNLEDQEQLGRHGDPKTGNPKGKIAWKFAEERAEPIVRNIEWTTGRTGAVKPVAEFDMVPLAGTEVRRATLHNLGFIFRNNIGVGTKITILKAGKIIPKVIGVKEGPKDYQTVEDVGAPLVCPTCNTPTTIRQNKDQFELFCPNQDCTAQNVAGAVHFLSTIGVLGLGEAKVEMLMEVVKKFSDFFKLTTEEAMSCGLSQRQAELAIAGIHMIPAPDKQKDLSKAIQQARKTKKVIPAWRFFAAFGMESAGKSCGKALISHFGSLDVIRQLDIEALESVPDVGNKTATIVYEYLRKHSDEIDSLLQFIELELPNTEGALSGKNFVFTGVFPEGKSHWEKAVEAAGGKVSSSVSKKTDFVVVGSDAGSKAEKADKLGIKKLNSEELKAMLGLSGSV